MVRADDTRFGIRRTPSEVPPNPGADHVDLDGAPLKEVRFRLQRYSADELKNLRLHLVFFDSDGRLRRVPVLDFSERGLGIAAPGDLVLRAGEVLRDVEVQAGERTIFRGHATIVHQPARPDRLGLALSGSPLEIDSLLAEDQRAGALAAFEHHLADLRAQLDPAAIPDSYRAAVADLVTVLTGLNGHLGETAGTLGDVGLTAEGLDRVEDLVVPEFLRLVAKMSEAMRDAGADGSYAAGAYSKRLLHPLLLAAKIPKRAYEKPLGYAGDFELMHMIYRQHDSGRSVFARVVNRLCCRLPVSRAGILRIAMLTEFLEAEIAARPGRQVRIGSMACGPAEEIVRLCERLGPAGSTDLSVALIDQDKEALSFCNRRFLRMESRDQIPAGVDIGYFHTAVKTFVTRPEELDPLIGKFDVLYTVGLFDYLADPAARALIASLSRFVAPGGVLLIGNFAHHDAEVFMEHVLDWRLLYRDAAGMEALARSALARTKLPFELDVISEVSGTHLFLVLRRSR